MYTLTRHSRFTIETLYLKILENIFIINFFLCQMLFLHGALCIFACEIFLIPATASAVTNIIIYNNNSLALMALSLILLYTRL